VSAQAGVTLIELLVVLVIISIALSVVVPTLSNRYDSWNLRFSARRAVALFRLASDTARREGTDIVGYYDDHRLVLQRGGTIYKELNIPSSVELSPRRPKGVVFLSTGQIVATDTFVFSNVRGANIIIEFGPLPGQVQIKEASL
jgi:prepilin-type N-terminal cleavage/methylation domain-containing protein